MPATRSGMTHLVDRSADLCRMARNQSRVCAEPQFNDLLPRHSSRWMIRWVLRLAKEPFDCVALPHRGFREAVGGSAFRPDEDAAIGEVKRPGFAGDPNS